MKAVIRIIQALLTAVWLALLAVSVLLFKIGRASCRERVFGLV